MLGSLPYINPLFQRRATDKQRSELIVALVPHVLPYASPEVYDRNEEELMRARDPLVTGPLCRNPRPYEPRLYDPYLDERRCHVLDRYDPFCQDGACAPQAAKTICHPRRLPPIVDRNGDSPAAEIAAQPASYTR